MVLDISVGSVSAACAVAGLTGKLVHWLVAGALEKRDTRIGELEKSLRTKDADIEKSMALKDRELEGAFKVVKDTQKLLFQKLDEHYKEFQDYRLIVAEKYVAAAALKEILAPLVSRLESIEHDFRQERA